jgi:hypothetical protein
MFFACIANTGVTGAIVVRVANAGVKVECFHTLQPPLVSADSKGFRCYPLSYYSGRIDGICGDSCVNESFNYAVESRWHRGTLDGRKWLLLNL